MRTIQEKYNAILEGKFSKSQFVKDAKRELSQFLSPYNGYEDTVSILKSKGVIYEAKKQEVPEYDKPAPGYSIETLERAVDYELEGMGLMSHETVSEEDYAKAKKKAEKNLEKDVNHYLHLLSGDSKKVDKHDKYVEVKKNNHVDTINGLKKAELKEGVESLKEEVVDLIGLIKSKYPEVSNNDIKDFIKMHFADIQAGADPMEEFEQFLSVNPEILNVDEKKGKDLDGDGDVDSDDYMAAKDRAIKKAMGKEVNERVGALQDFISLIQDRAVDSEFSEEEEALEVIEAIADHYGIKIQVGGFVGEVNEGRRRKMKGGKVVTENDYETGGYVESMGPMLEKAMKQLEAVWEEWKAGPATEAAMVPHAKKDLVSYLESRITVGEDIVEDTVEEHQELKEAFKAIISKVLQEEVITEAATGNLSKIASTYNDFEGFQAAINDLENIVTDVESYYAKTKDKIQKVYDSFKDIKNTEGLAVGAMLGPAIESAFRKDLMPVTEKGFTKGLEMPKVKMLETDEIAEEELEEKETVFKPINEALNKELIQFGPDLKKRLDSVGFKTGIFKGQTEVPLDAIKKIADNPDLAGIAYKKLPDGYEQMQVSVNRKRIKDLEKVKKYFSTPEGQYGPEKDLGWFIKNVRNVNPGDIYSSKIGGTADIATVTYFRAEEANSGQFDTEKIKSREKFAAEGKNYKYTKRQK